MLGIEPLYFYRFDAKNCVYNLEVEGAQYASIPTFAEFLSGQSTSFVTPTRAPACSHGILRGAKCQLSQDRQHVEVDIAGESILFSLHRPLRVIDPVLNNDRETLLRLSAECAVPLWTHWWDQRVKESPGFAQALMASPDWLPIFKLWVTNQDDFDELELQWLLDHGADLNAINDEGASVLVYLLSMKQHSARVLPLILHHTQLNPTLALQQCEYHLRYGLLRGRGHELLEEIGVLESRLLSDEFRDVGVAITKKRL